MKKNKLLQQFLKIIVIVGYFLLGYYLFSLIDKKYEKSIPQIFWAILFALFIIGFSIERNKTKKVLTISTMVLLVIMQALVLLIPAFHAFVYQLFAWSSF